MIANGLIKPVVDGPVLTDVRMLVRDSIGWLQGAGHEDIALTLIGLTSEDPDDWSDLCGHWLRYHTPTVPRDVHEIPLRRCDHPDLTSLEHASGWVAVDLEQRRVQTGGLFQELERSTIYDMTTQGSAKPRNQDGWALPVFLPPWWELQQHTQPAAVVEPRDAPLDRPRTNRGVLYGEAVRKDFAGRIARVVASEAWRMTRPSSTRQCYDWIVETHRDWLMSARADLGGHTVREQLHAALQWLEDLVDGQRTRASEIQCVVARPVPELLDDHSPMSREEVCEYFEFCRAMLVGGFRWAIDATANRSTILRDQAKVRAAIAAALERAGVAWLDTRDEDGFSRRFAREAARRRMPLVLGIPIHGMKDVQGAADGKFSADGVCNGPFCEGDPEHAQHTHPLTFICYDGYHLDHDLEFAFSLCEDEDEWEFLYGGHEEPA